MTLNLSTQGNFRNNWQEESAQGVLDKSDKMI